MTLTFNPRPDTNMAKLIICVKDYFRCHVFIQLHFLYVILTFLNEFESLQVSCIESEKLIKVKECQIQPNKVKSLLYQYVNPNTTLP